jgi:GNAT superfamily N-acetyltransferase
MGLRIRKAGLEDMEHIGILWETMVEELRRDIPDLNIMADSKGYFQRFAGVGILAGSACVFMAVSADGPEGFVMGQIITPEPPFIPEPYGYIVALFIREGWRGKGSGKALVRSLSEWFAGRGVRRMELHAYYHEENAVRFWQQLDFRPLGLRLGSPVKSVIK